MFYRNLSNPSFFFKTLKRQKLNRKKFGIRFHREKKYKEATIAKTVSNSL